MGAHGALKPIEQRPLFFSNYVLWASSCNLYSEWSLASEMDLISVELHIGADLLMWNSLQDRSLN